MNSSGFMFIDGNNMAHKALHTCTRQDLDGNDVGVMYGFLRQFITARQALPGLMPLIVWDGGYKQRTKLSKRGVDLGIIPSAYKENRDDDEKVDPLKKKMLYDQLPALQKIISVTDIPQVAIPGQEADDVIASYCKKMKGSGKTIVCYTVDRDYYQLIDDNVIVTSRINGEFGGYNKEEFIEEFGIEPWQWVDVGALSGDTGDNIFGVPGIGGKTAVKLIAEHKTYVNVIKYCVNKFAPLRAEFPDLKTKEEIDELINSKKDLKINPYDGCYVGMPFTGVALAAEKKQIKSPKAVELRVAMYQIRIELAYRLKMMNSDIVIPELSVFNRFDINNFDAACSRHMFGDLVASSHYFSKESFSV